MLKFVVFKNLAVRQGGFGEPWKFEPPPALLAQLKLTKKEERARVLSKEEFEWCVYSPVIGLVPTERVSNENEAVALHGVVADYDIALPLESVKITLRNVPIERRPTFLELSLSNRFRLVWMFERPILINGNRVATRFIELFFEFVNAKSLLAAFDPASVRPTQVWTNGGQWFLINETPVSFERCRDLSIKAHAEAKIGLGNEAIPLEVVAKEVEKRFPGRWQGSFELDRLGVRFWDPLADCPTGCQVKPDGMLCFTGPVPFMTWADIFGAEWARQEEMRRQTELMEGIWFDGTHYWERVNGKWVATTRQDIALRLRARGASTKTIKGRNITEVENVLNTIQIVNRIDGAAPFINYPPGLIELAGRRYLNIAELRVVQPEKGTGDPDQDFPFLKKFLWNLFARPELRPLEHFLGWLQRSYRAMLCYERLAGQAVFLCGPKNNGKTLLCLKIIAPLLGNRTADPMDYLLGETQFSDDLFSASLLAINDQDSPKTETARQKMLSRLKALVVNPSHTYHAKFRSRIMTEWTGRVVVTCNDDPGSTGILPEVSMNTMDKLSFFATQAFRGTWPDRKELEATIERELPRFGWWLLNKYAVPEDTRSNDRVGIKSYFDPVLLAIANRQVPAFNLVELIEAWILVAPWWQEHDSWRGTPTQLLSELTVCEATAAIARTWSQERVTRALTVLAKQKNTCVEFADRMGRKFVINRPMIETPPTIAEDLEE